MLVLLQINREQAMKADPQTAGRATENVDVAYDAKYECVERNYGNAVFRKHGPPETDTKAARTEDHERRRKLVNRMLKRMGKAAAG